VFRVALLSAFMLLAGCGYVGPVLPPSPEIPTQVMDLAAAQRGDKIVVTFRTPPRTTDNIAIKEFSEIDLRIGPALQPFDFESWAVSAKRYSQEPPAVRDPLDPQPIPITVSVPLEGLLGKHVAVAVRTAVKRDHYSSWSNRIELDVNRPLATPTGLKASSTADGIVLKWQSVDLATGYRVLRQSLEIGKSDKAEFLDATSQYDTEYSYQVIATSGSAEGLPSEIAKVTPVDKFPPAVPTGVTALAGPESVEVSWQRNSETDLQGYIVYRSVDNGVLEKQGELINLPAFSDKKVEQGKTYRYQISAIDKTGNESAKSTASEATF
jgi:hypothetical protein